MLKSIIAGACLCAASIAEAQSSSLSGQEINDLVAGATVEIDTPTGVKLPIRYARDGKLSGEARSLAWYLGAVSDNGRWWVASDRLCHKWARWFNSAPQCMRLSKAGRTIRWRNQDGYGGTAMISVPVNIQAAAVLPRAQPDRLKQTASPAPASAPKEQAAERVAGAGQPSQQAAIETVGQARPAEAQPVHAFAAPDKSLSQQQQTEPKRAAQPMFKVSNVRSDDVLNVRSGPSADSDIVGELPPRSRGIAITSACRSNWCPVQHRSMTGWVNSAYLTPEEAS